MIRNGMDIKFVLDGDIGLYSVLVDGEAVLECLEEDEILDMKVKELLEEY